MSLFSIFDVQQEPPLSAWSVWTEWDSRKTYTVYMYKRDPSLDGGLDSLCRSMRFCHSLAALVGPVQSISFLTVTYFTSVVPIANRPSWANGFRCVAFRFICVYGCILLPWYPPNPFYASLQIFSDDIYVDLHSCHAVLKNWWHSLVYCIYCKLYCTYTMGHSTILTSEKPNWLSLAALTNAFTVFPKTGNWPGGHYKMSKKGSKAQRSLWRVTEPKRRVRSVHGRVARPKPTSNNILQLWLNISPSSASPFLVRNYLDSWESLRPVFLWVSNWARVENPSNVSIWPQKRPSLPSIFDSPSGGFFSLLDRPRSE